MTDPFDALGDKRRREVLELLADGEQSVGAVVDAMQSLAQPLDALETEIARGRRDRRAQASSRAPHRTNDDRLA